MKRTDLETLRGFFWAAAKSELSDGLLGDVKVGEVVSAELEENCEVRSLS